jgi:ABC-type xylose transport system permease subunit
MKPEDVTPELLQWLKTTAEKSSDFVQEQAPLLAREIVAWHFWSSIFLVVVFAFLWLASLALAFWIFRQRNKSHNWQSDVEPFCGIAAAIVLMSTLFFFLMGCCHNGYNAVKASCAPRLIVLEKIGTLMKR